MAKNSKKTMNAPVLAIIVLTLIAIAIFAPSITGSLIGISMACNDGEYISTDSFYNNGTLHCSAVASGSGKYGELLLSPENSVELTGVPIQQTAKLTAEVLKDDCRYEFDNESIPIKEYSIRYKKIIWANGWKCENWPPTLSGGWVLVGITPLTGDMSLRTNVEAGSKFSGCDVVYERTVGVVHRLDPSKFYDYAYRVNMSVGGTTYSGTVDKTHQSIYTDAFRVENLGANKGIQDCPAQPQLVAFIKNSVEPVPLEYKNKYNFEPLYASQLGIVDVYSALNQANAHNSILTSFLGSTGSFGQYCEPKTSEATSIYEAQVTCDPEGTVSIPEFDLYINAEKVGIGVPSGNPEIVEVKAGESFAAEKSEVLMTVTNSGESDSFDASIKCTRDLSPFSSREYIASGTTKTISIVYEGAGLIGDCEAEVHSVGSPQKNDMETVNLNIKPFCPRTPINSNQKTVFTEFGCAFVCDNYGAIDSAGNTIDSHFLNCQRINNNPGEYSITGKLADYDRCTYDENMTCIDKRDYEGIHCTGIGRYTGTETYMDRTADGDPMFAPEKLPHKYFIVQIDGEPVCDYVNEYGYDGNGNAIAELEFDYNEPFPEAIAEDGTPPEDSLPPIVIPPTVAGDKIFGIELMHILISVGLALFAIGGYAYMKRRRK